MTEKPTTLEETVELKIIIPTRMIKSPMDSLKRHATASLEMMLDTALEDSYDKKLHAWYANYTIAKD